MAFAGYDVHHVVICFSFFATSTCYAAALSELVTGRDVNREALKSTKIVTPRIPVVSNVDAQPHSDPEAIRDILARQVVPNSCSCHCISSEACASSLSQKCCNWKLHEQSRHMFQAHLSCVGSSPRLYNGNRQSRLSWSVVSRKAMRSDPIRSLQAS